MNYRLTKRGTVFFGLLAVLVLVMGGVGSYTLLKLYDKPASLQPATDVTKPADVAATPAAISLQYATDDMNAMMAVEDHEMNMKMPAAVHDGDVARANEILASLHENLDKYQDVDVAMADGYATQAKSTDVVGQVYHFHTAQKKNGQKLDPAKPNGLLYQRGTNGKLNFVGVMYIAGPTVPDQQLNDAFYPLSQSVWHQHVNICRTQDNSKKIGVNTKAACDAKGGVFSSTSSWMTHLFLFQLEPETGSSASDDKNI